MVVALSSVIKPSDIILNKLKEFNVTSIVKMASSYKFCVLQQVSTIFMQLKKELMSGIMLPVMLLLKMLEQLSKLLMKNRFYMEKKTIEIQVC